MTSLETGLSPHTFCELDGDAGLALAIARTTALLGVLRAEQLRRLRMEGAPQNGRDYVSLAGALEAVDEFDQRLANDASEPGRDYME